MKQVWLRLFAQHLHLAVAGGAVLLAAIPAIRASPAASAPLAAHRAPGTALAPFLVSISGGDAERLARAPPRPTGPGTGVFTSNVMDVTGTVTSLPVSGRSAVFWGKATVTGLGAGHDRPFTVKVTAGGPGTAVLLTVSGLTFHEILTNGHFDVS